MSVRLIYKNAVVFFLSVMWIYAAVSKILDWDHFKWEMHNQVLPLPLKDGLIYLLPAVEFAVALLLFTEKTVALALGLSFLMMCAFAAYIGLVLGHAFNHIPCSCGGILSHMGWAGHLIFNLTVLVFNLIAMIINRKGGKTAKII